MTEGEGEQETRGQRIYLIREALGTRRDAMPLDKFADLIQRTTGADYDKSVLSRKEKGQIPVSIDDIDAIAPVDPLKRGKARLAGWEAEAPTADQERRTTVVEGITSERPKGRRKA